MERVLLQSVIYSQTLTHMHTHTYLMSEAGSIILTITFPYNLQDHRIRVPSQKLFLSQCCLYNLMVALNLGNQYSG